MIGAERLFLYSTRESFKWEDRRRAIATFAGHWPGKRSREPFRPNVASHNFFHCYKRTTSRRLIWVDDRRANATEKDRWMAGHDFHWWKKKKEWANIITLVLCLASNTAQKNKRDEFQNNFRKLKQALFEYSARYSLLLKIWPCSYIKMDLFLKHSYRSVP